MKYRQLLHMVVFISVALLGSEAGIAERKLDETVHQIVERAVAG